MRILFISLLFLNLSANAVQYQCFVDEDCLYDEYCEQRQCKKLYPVEDSNKQNTQNCFSDSDCAPEQYCESGMCQDNWPCG